MSNDAAHKKIVDAMRLFDEGDFKKAYSQFKKLTQEFPDDAEC